MGDKSLNEVLGLVFVSVVLLAHAANGSPLAGKNERMLAHKQALREVDDYCVNGTEPGELEEYNGMIYSGIDLRCKVFEEHTLNVSGFVFSSLEGVTFKDCTFLLAIVRSTELENALFSDSVIQDSSSFVDSDFQDSRFEGMTISNSWFDGATFHNAKLETSSFSAVDFFDCTMTTIEFNRVQITSSNFSELSMIEGFVRDSVISDSAFAGADMKRTRFVDSTLRNCDLTGADLGDTEWDRGNEIEDSDFSGARLVNADMRGVSIDTASKFDGANCFGMRIDGGCTAFCEARNCSCVNVELTPTPMPTPTPTNNPAGTNPTATATATPNAGSDPVCFPGGARVELQNGLRVPMHELQPGDRIRVHAHGSTAKVEDEFEPVMMFIHQEFDVTAAYTELDLESGSRLSASDSHYVFVQAPDFRSRLVSAGKAQVGDIVLRADGSHDRISAVRHGVVKRGVFNPHTPSGVLYVDGVRVSCYTTALHPVVAHFLLVPYRIAAAIPALRILSHAVESLLAHGAPRSLAHLTTFLTVAVLDHSHSSLF